MRLKSLQNTVRFRSDIMNKRKLKCNHPGCEWEGYVRSKGKCPYHRSLELNTGKTKTWRKTGKQGSERSEFFKKYLSEPYDKWSLESGVLLRPFTVFNICHILPKRTYTSVEFDYLNIIHLTQDEHSRFDRLLDTNNFKRLEEEFPKTMKEIRLRMPVLLKKVVEEGKIKYNIEQWMNG